MGQGLVASKDMGLNRTSVGLKHDDGIAVGDDQTCLNRTSVGLKLVQTLEVVPRGGASIEPAWD